MSDDNGIVYRIPTVGEAIIAIQDGRTAYVRAGTGDTDDPTGPLTVRGVALRFRGHFKLRENGWELMRGYGHLHRVDSTRDATPAMLGKVAEAVCAVLTEEIHENMLKDAAKAKAEQEASVRAAMAGKLRECAAALTAEAEALRAGGRVVYLKYRLSSGFEERVRTVQLPNGKRLQPVPEPPDMRNWSARYPLNARELASATEED